MRTLIGYKGYELYFINLFCLIVLPLAVPSFEKNRTWQPHLQSFANKHNKIKDNYKKFGKVISNPSCTIKKVHLFPRFRMHVNPAANAKHIFEDAAII